MPRRALVETKILLPSLLHCFDVVDLWNTEVADRNISSFFNVPELLIGCSEAMSNFTDTIFIQFDVEYIHLLLLEQSFLELYSLLVESLFLEQTFLDSYNVLCEGL